MEFSQNQIDSIVQSVVAQMQGTTPTSAPAYDSTQYNGRQYLGVYATMEEGIDAAADSYKVIRNMSVEQREKIITEIRKLTRAEAEIMSKLCLLYTSTCWKNWVFLLLSFQKSLTLVAFMACCLMIFVKNWALQKFQ